MWAACVHTVYRQYSLSSPYDCCMLYECKLYFYKIDNQKKTTNSTLHKAHSEKKENKKSKQQQQP